MVEIGGRSILEWQLLGLADNGIDDVTVVTGFGAQLVEDVLERVAPAIGVRVQTIYNPFYAVSDNIGSCWAARDAFTADTVLLNGDTLFEGAVLSRLLASGRDGITVTCDVKERYDSDDMKVRVSGSCLTAIGKRLDGQIDGESIGMIRFCGEGSSRFTKALRSILADPEALGRWYLSVIHDLAQDGGVFVARLNGERWGEVDFPMDLPVAEAAVAAFRRGRTTEQRTAV